MNFILVLAGHDPNEQRSGDQSIELYNSVEFQSIYSTVDSRAGVIEYQETETKEPDL